MSDPQIFTRKMLAWYQQERRQAPIPGRAGNDPYAIWVAEVMLQQT